MTAPLTPAGAPGDLSIWRDEHGVVHVRATGEGDRYWGLGYAHGLDRGLQVLMMRILGQGRAAEFLDAELLEVDRFFRRMNWHGGLQGEISKLSPGSRGIVDAYCAGLNARLERKRPWELKLTGYVHEPWRPQDCVLLSRMTGYLTLAQSQAEVERLVVEMVQGGAPIEHLRELFTGLLDELDVALLRSVTLGERMVPEAVKWLGGLSPAMASNNWAVSGEHTRSGQAMLANDPHLEVNRLPNVWYEVCLESAGTDEYGVGFSMAGLPALLVGRTRHLAWGATYTFMDAVDSWVEECREGRFRRGEDEWVAFSERRETVRLKGRPASEAVELTFYENDHGTLDGDPHVSGRYLATRWAPGDSGAASLHAAIEVGRAKTVAQGMAALAPIEMAFNWVFADSAGCIGYQMSGRMPRRRAGVSGLVPLPGWDPANDWQGWVPVDELPRCVDPPEGFIVTANQDLNHLGVADPINMPMGTYRADRITEVLSASSDHDHASFGRLHMDLQSPQAARFLAIVEPLLPDNAAGHTLRAWDRSYDTGSEGAWLFEHLYAALLVGVFGRTFGEPVVRYLLDETGTFTDFYANLDRILLSEQSVWFGGRSRDDLFREIAEAALADDLAVGRWGQRQEITLAHMLFGGKLPHWVGFDRGPIELPGGRATVHQGQVYRSGGRTTSFAPSIRMIVDFASDGAWTRLCGGPSDRRFSKWYCNELTGWVDGTFKQVAADS